MKITARLPYFLQVVLVHLNEEAGRLVLPVVNRRCVQRVIFRYVLPELSDYLTAQWRSVAEDVQEEVGQNLFQNWGNPEDFLESFGRSESASYPREPQRNFGADRHPEQLLVSEPGKYSARARQMLKRVGLSGADDLIIAPLVAVWLLEGRKMDS